MTPERVLSSAAIVQTYGFYFNGGLLRADLNNIFSDFQTTPKMLSCLATETTNTRVPSDYTLVLLLQSSEVTITRWQ